jgi:hypothetical protein
LQQLAPKEKENHSPGLQSYIELIQLPYWVELMLWPTVSRPVHLGVGHPFFFYWTIALLFVLGRPLWLEDRPVICSVICQWSEPRRTHKHTLLSHLRLLGSLSVTSYDSQELHWKHSNPPPHGDASIYKAEELAITESLKSIQNY